MGIRSDERKEWFFDQAGITDVLQHYFDTILVKNVNWEVLEFHYIREKTNL